MQSADEVLKPKVTKVNEFIKNSNLAVDKNSLEFGR